MNLSAWTGRARRLAERIETFVTSDGESEPFEALALDVDRWQRANDTQLAALTDSEPADWKQIPAVPVSLHKHLNIGTAPIDAPIVLKTSGTTGGGRGRHRLRSTALYDLGSMRHFHACVPDPPTDIVALLIDATRHPESSLSHMVALFGDVGWYWDGEVDRIGLDASITNAQGPLFLASTAFALAEWLDGEVPALPAGSVLMTTGGFKGRKHRLDGNALFAEAQERLQPERLVTEYGMTELSSQLWGTPTTPYRPPAWLRAYTVDPWTGDPLEVGEEGQLRFVDLCNLDGPLAIETMDQGWVNEDGSVELIGRLPGAPARGCSLTVEEAWEAR